MYIFHHGLCCRVVRLNLYDKKRNNRIFSSSDVSCRLSRAVVRVLTPWRGGRSAHLIGALNAYLSRPGQPLPPDPGPGSGYPIAARLDGRLIARAKAMAGETSQAALIRRVLLWRYFQKPVAASARPNPSGIPVSNPARVRVAERQAVVPPSPVATSKVADNGNRSEMGLPPSIGEEPRRDNPPPKNLSDQEYIRRLYEGRI